jgi:hypothetical protein
MASQSSLDWEAYHARWGDIWKGGLQKGQVCAVWAIIRRLGQWLQAAQMQIKCKAPIRFTCLTSSVQSSTGVCEDRCRCTLSHLLQAFDKGHCSPQLLHLIDSGALPVQGKKAFVPGCG